MTEKRCSLIRAAGLLLVVLTCLGSIACSKLPPEAELKKELEKMLPVDLDSITSGVPADALIEKPYYRITALTSNKEAKCMAKAEVEFYFLKNVNVVILRKFCYHESQKKWVRFFNEYKNVSSSVEGAK
jgi:predicted exporter